MFLKLFTNSSYYDRVNITYRIFWKPKVGWPKKKTQLHQVSFRQFRNLCNKVAEWHEGLKYSGNKNRRGNFIIGSWKWQSKGSDHMIDVRQTSIMRFWVIWSIRLQVRNNLFNPMTLVLRALVQVRHLYICWMPSKRGHTWGASFADVRSSTFYLQDYFECHGTFFKLKSADYRFCSCLGGG